MARDIPLDKASPEETAENILNGIESNEPDIFPDAAGRQLFDVWQNDYRDLEKIVLEMHEAA